MTVAVWPADSPVPGLVMPAVDEPLVVAAAVVALELPALAAPPEAVEALPPALDELPLLPHPASSRVVNTADNTSRPR